MSPLTILVSACVLAAGIALGWLLGARPLADLRARLSAQEDEARDLRARFGDAVKDLAATSERARLADALSAQLAAEREERGVEMRELATLRANTAHFEEQKTLLVAAREELLREFQNTGSRVLGKAQEEFLKAANERFGHAEKASEAKLKALLDPVGKTLKSYEEQVANLERQRVDAFGQLNGQIEALRTGQEQVRLEALRLGNSLRNAPKARGRWGEQQLRNVLEQCGLAEHTDFETEHSITTEDGRLRPDAIVRIPGNKLLVIDAKVSLNAYQDAFEAEDEVQRDAHLAAHAQSMRNHINTLGAKSYQSQFENASDYVVMFVPGEHFIAAALDHDSGIWDYAFDRRVLLASPTNLVAIARTIAQVWQQEGLAREAREIGKLGADLYDSLAKTQEDLMKTGVHLGRAVNSFNDFARTYEGNVMSRARRLGDKHIKIGKREVAEDVPQIESAPRYGETQDAEALPSAAGDDADPAR